MNYLILGGTSGIGLEVVKKLSKKNQVFVLGRNFEKLNNLNLDNIFCLHHEVVSFESLDLYFKKELYGTAMFDGILNCVGVEGFKMTKLITDRDYQNIFLPPVIAFFIILKYSAKKNFINPCGSIITMSSVSSVKGKGGMMLYGAARAALESMVKHAASDLGERNIRVNAIRSGAVKTPMHERSTKNMNQETLDNFRKSHLLGFGEVADIVSLIEFMFSKKSKWITGTSITADGGYLAE
jgi:NAD(P)-dependent dehydrogenase (short-subunit alcohol dehydrogenase family)